MLPKKGVPSAFIRTVRRWCQDYAAGLEESSIGEVPRLHKFWVFVAPCKSKRQLTPESAECCQTRDGSRRPSREVPAQTATGKPGMPLWTWCTTTTLTVRPWPDICPRVHLPCTPYVSPVQWRRRHGIIMLYRCPNSAEFDWQTLTGRMCHYYTYGAAVVKVELDCLTGQYTVLA